jgi:hypothetical protein
LNMFTPISYDVATPYLAFGIVLAVLTLVIGFVEALVLHAKQWGSFGRSLGAALLMNAVSTLFGFLLIAYISWAKPYIWLPVSFGLSVLIEAGILLLLKRQARRQNWDASLKANLASYVLVILPCIIWPEIINGIANIFL